MSDSKEKFARFQQEHARLHDPALLRGAVELVPVPWNEVISDRSKKTKTGKKKLWRELRRLAGESTGERLLPLEFIEGLQPEGEGQRARAAAARQEGSITAAVEAGKKAYREEARKREMSGPIAEGQPTFEKPQEAARSTEEPRGTSSITIEPASVTCALNLFQEEAFGLDAPAARRVELVWLAEQMPKLQRVVMDHESKDRFETRVGLDDGSYLFAFAVDDYMRPDPRLAHNVVLNQQGLFAPLRQARQLQMFVVTNRGAGDESILLEAGAEWLSPETATIDLAAGESARISARFNAAAMKPGLNETLLCFSVRRGDAAVPARTVHIAVQVEVGGAVPDFVFKPDDFGEVMQGMNEVRLRVELTARGRGPLTGMIRLPHSGELADFRLDADDEVASHFEHTFQIDSSNLPQPQPHRAEAALRVMLLSDSFLSNYRLREFDVPYRLIYLKKSLPALSFGIVRVGGTKTLRLDVMRSDAREIELTVELPAGAENYLEAYSARAGTYVFRFDAGSLRPGSSVNETVKLRDGRSGLRSQIKILGAVALAAGEPAHTATN
jgi:hypothetical protein